MIGQGESESAYIKRRFTEAVDEDMLDTINDQLREEGITPEKISPRKSERRKELRKQSKTGTTAMTRSTAQLPAEQIVDNLPWPMNVNGEVDPAFVAGMRYEAMNVIRGIRMAQELNKMGLEQAKPVIEMAKEMRQAEGQAAQTLASQFGQVTMQSNQQIISAIHDLAGAQSQGQPAASENPMAKALFSAMQPYIQQTVGQVLAGLFKGKPPVPTQGGQMPVSGETANQPVPTATPDSKPLWMSDEEEDQWTEV